EHQRALTTADLIKYAEKIGLDIEQFKAALEDHRHRAAIQKDVMLARRLGVRGTPTFFINGRPIVGAQPYWKFEEMVTEEIQTANSLLAQGVPKERLYETFMAAAKAQRGT